MKKTTLCYISIGEKLLMIKRNKKKNDENAGKYIGLGGHFLEGETPEECILREVYEESGIMLSEYAYRGIVTFCSDLWGEEEMHLFSATAHPTTLPECDEGELCLVSKEELFSLKLWEGDLIFLSLLFENAPFFKLTLNYRGDKLCSAYLDGRPAELLDLLDEKGNKTNRFKERSMVHRDGDWHGTVHIWIYAYAQDGLKVLLQKRAQNKESYPGCYDISSAGHLLRGESYEEAARRELKEELGLDVKKEDLYFSGFYDHCTNNIFWGSPFIDREHTAIYLLHALAVNIGNIVLQEEVEQVCWFDVKKLLLQLNEPSFCIAKEELEEVINNIEKSHKRSFPL